MPCFIAKSVLFFVILVLFYLSTALCRHLKFTASVDGYALFDHVIKNISLNLEMRDSCKGRCTMENNCVSINIGPPINDKVLCQLSNSDHIQHPDDVKPRDGFTYRATEVDNSDYIIFYSALIFVSFSVCLSACLFFCLFVYLLTRLLFVFCGSPASFSAVSLTCILHPDYSSVYRYLSQSRQPMILAFNSILYFNK